MVYVFCCFAGMQLLHTVVQAVPVCRANGQDAIQSFVITADRYIVVMSIILYFYNFYSVSC